MKDLFLKDTNRGIGKKILIFVVLYLIIALPNMHFLLENRAIGILGDGELFYNGYLPQINSILDGNFSLWDKWSMCGTPTANFYPVWWLFGFLPPTICMFLYFTLHISIAAFFFYKFLKEIGCTEVSSFAMAVIYEYSIHLNGARTVHMTIITASAMLPIVLFFIQRYANTRKIKNILYAAIPLSFGFLGGHTQYSFYLCAITSAYFIIVSKKSHFSWSKTIASFAAYIGTFISFSAVMLLPTVLSIVFFRGDAQVDKLFEYFCSGSTSLGNIFQMFFANYSPNVYESYNGVYTSGVDIEFFVGTLSLILILYTVKHNKDNFFVKLSAVFLILDFGYMCLGTIPILNKIAFNIPFISSFRYPSRALFIFIFFTLVLMCFGLSDIEKNADRYTAYLSSRSKIYLLTIIAICFGTIVYANYYNAGQSADVYRTMLKVFGGGAAAIVLYNILVYIGKKLSAKWKGDRIVSLFCICAYGVITLVELLSINSSLDVGISMEETYSQNVLIETITKEQKETNFKAVTVAASDFSCNQNVYYKIPTVTGFSAYTNNKLYRLLAQGQTAMLNQSGILATLPNFEHLLNDNDILSMLGVKWILDGSGTIPDDGCVQNYEGSGEILLSTPELTAAAVGDDGSYFSYSETIDVQSNTPYLVSFDAVLPQACNVNTFYFDIYGWSNFNRSDIVLLPGENHYSMITTTGAVEDAFDPNNIYFRIISIADKDITLSNISIERLDTKEADYYTKLNDDGETKLFENKNAKDVLSTVENVVKTPNPEYVYANSDILDFINNAYVTDCESEDLAASKVSISNIDFKNNYINADYSSNGKAFVNFAQCYHPGWKAFVDGKEVALHITNGVTMGMFVDSGEHKISFRFINYPVIIGVVMMCVCIVVWVVVLNRKSIIKLFKKREVKK